METARSALLPRTQSPRLTPQNNSQHLRLNLTKYALNVTEFSDTFGTEASAVKAQTIAQVPSCSMAMT